MNRAKEENYFQKIKNATIDGIYGFLTRLFGQRIAKIIFVIILVLIVLVFVVKDASNAYSSYWQGRAAKQDVTEKEKMMFTSAFPSQTPFNKKELLKIKGVDTLKNPCHGESIEFYQLDDITGQEMVTILDANDPNLVTASTSANFQVAKKFSPKCKIPFIATVSFVPLKEQSIGVFFEWDSVFKVIIGDGDRRAWKVERGLPNRTIQWDKVDRGYIPNKELISINKEVSVKIKAQRSPGGLEITMYFHYSPEKANDYRDWFQAVYIPISDFDLTNIPSRSFRIGINDFSNQGQGSLIRFGPMRIEEI